MIRILLISGSLRRVSINSAVLRAVERLAPNNIETTFYTGLGELPLFNPDIEANPPKSVIELLQQIAQADGLIIASPEYAHGITGAMKNALDWAVGGSEFVQKPITLLNTSQRATIAYASLKEIVKTMDGNICESASVQLPLSAKLITTDEILADPVLVKLLSNVLTCFSDYVIAGQLEK